MSDKFLLLRGILFLYLTLLMIRLAESNVFEYMNCYISNSVMGWCYILHRKDTGVFQIAKLVMMRVYVAKMFNLFNSFLFSYLNDLGIERPMITIGRR